MLRLRRPAEPDHFEQCVEVQRKLIEMRFTHCMPLGEEDLFKDLWSDFKAAFFEAQHQKCGYCEVTLISHTGHIDHYRPKGSVEELPNDPALWGSEIHGTTHVRGRDCRQISPHGYYWLAYTWTNYVLSCERCNTAWKKALFPVVGSSRYLPPSCEVEETPLLLNPFDDPDPLEHLRFGQLGEVFACNGSIHGWETIRTCGLDRPSLRRSREPIVKRVHSLLRRIFSGNAERAKEALDDLKTYGDRVSQHAGMVRILVYEHTSLTWRQMFGED